MALLLAAQAKLQRLFPRKVHLDPNGRKHQWEWVALLPFLVDRGVLKRCSSKERVWRVSLSCFPCEETSSFKDFLNMLLFKVSICFVL